MTETIKVGSDFYHVDWLPKNADLNEGPVVQASSVAFTKRNRVVLVSTDANTWVLPGGHVETGESPSDAMAREAYEEATARVLRGEYIGATRVEPLVGDSGPFYQARYWALVELEKFRPSDEALYRSEFKIEEVAGRLGWESQALAKSTIDAALAVHRLHF